MRQHDLGYVTSLYGGFWSLNVRDFCYMTNPFFPPDELIESLGANIRVLTKSYPSTNWHLSDLVARPLGLTHEEVVVGNGASELINAITSRYVGNLAVPVPTFDEFINRAVLQGRHISPYLLEGDFQLNAEGFIRHVRDSGADSALLIRPNNPTGTYMAKAVLLGLLESLRYLRLVLVDDSFIDFVTYEADCSALDLIGQFPNMVVLKSLSKAYGIPGLRLGYAASGDREIIASLRRDVPIWSINSLAQLFLEEMGSYQQQFQDSCRRVKRATQVLFDGLQTVPYLRPYPTQGNFVLCRVADGMTVPELTARLYDEHQMIINDCSGKRGLEGPFVRMASRTEEENLELVRALRMLADTVPARRDDDRGVRV